VSVVAVVAAAAAAAAAVGDVEVAGFVDGDNPQAILVHSQKAT
jgi:hypothetical protein